MTSIDTSATPVSSRTIRLFAALTGVTSLLIFLQAVTAGEFVSQEDRDPWIDVHSIVGNITLIVALAVAIFTVIVFRAGHRVLMWASIALFVLLLIQTVLGHLITDAKQDGWIGVHVPLALVVFALTIWLSIRSVALRKANSQE
jgi:heme A synthase